MIGSRQSWPLLRSTNFLFRRYNLQVCFKCHILKPLSDFYRHLAMANGHLGKCKECNKKDTQANYRNRKDQYKVYYANRGKTEKRKAWNLNNQKKVRARHPLKYHCHSITSGAINRGKLLKQSCEICDSSLRVEAHHESYYEPLNVKWLCMKHHRELHKKIRSEEI